MSECVFCNIPKKTAEKMLYQDDVCYVVDDINPIERGHRLVVSKTHYESMPNAPDEVVSHMFVVAKRFAIKAKEEFGATGTNVGVNNGKDANQIVMHMHIHVLPRYPGMAHKRSHTAFIGIPK